MIAWKSNASRRRMWMMRLITAMIVFATLLACIPSGLLKSDPSTSAPVERVEFTTPVVEVNPNFCAR
jgi:hypothetical protein